MRVRLPATTSLAELARIQDSIGQDYPDKRSRVRFNSVVRFTGVETPEISSCERSEDGFIFRSDKHTRVLQARLDGFTVSWLRPYRNWEALRDETSRLWKEYIAVAQPEAVTRVALRYINRIDIPAPVDELEQWIRTRPNIPADVGTSMVELFMRVVLPLGGETFAVITQAVQPAPEMLNTVPLILDIDVFLRREFAPTDGEFWRDLERLHNLKNNLFFSSITERTKELFK